LALDTARGIGMTLSDGHEDMKKRDFVRRFRKFEMINKVMHINGKRIVFKGVNRHEFNCYHGRSVKEEDMLWDIKFLKQHNLNSVRTSHYPNNSKGTQRLHVVSYPRRHRPIQRKRIQAVQTDGWR
jgi:hypothetical protein